MEDDGEFQVQKLGFSGAEFKNPVSDCGLSYFYGACETRAVAKTFHSSSHRQRKVKKNAEDNFCLRREVPNSPYLTVFLTENLEQQVLGLTGKSDVASLGLLAGIIPSHNHSVLL